MSQYAKFEEMTKMAHTQRRFGLSWITAINGKKGFYLAELSQNVFTEELDYILFLKCIFFGGGWLGGGGCLC